MLTTQKIRGTTDEYEAIYADAGGNRTLVPWADEHPHPALVTWLNAVAPSLIRCGARVAVVGSGLGDDARELSRRGYEVTAFDASPTAVRWAQQIEPAHADCFHQADLFELPTRWRHRFDLVVEVNTLQSLPLDRRTPAVGAIADLLSPRGLLLVICRGTEQPVTMEDSPPWPLTERELSEAITAAGLVPAAPVSIFLDNETPPVRRMRGLFQRG